METADGLVSPTDDHVGSRSGVEPEVFARKNLLGIRTGQMHLNGSRTANKDFWIFSEMDAMSRLNLLFRRAPVVVLVTELGQWSGGFTHELENSWHQGKVRDGSLQGNQFRSLIFVGCAVKMNTYILYF